ncbi:hypothetical protein GCM10022279_01320 [Comamonas faecalis]|uniref:Chemotaxis protein n=1 Tax=Comamonas faecalis TaxID=1387849 RepID=A0ABP7QEZ8_9BURK
MAGWMTALRLVPWGKVIEATPQITQAARQLLRERRGGAGQPDPHLPPAAADASPHAEQLAALRQQVLALQQGQRADAALLQSLAEQNAQLVTTVGALRTGVRRMAWACIALALVLAGLLAWLLLR